MPSRIRLFAILLATLLAVDSATSIAWAQDKPRSKSSVQDRYTKKEVRIPMRDGVKLFTSIYVPKDTSHRYPFLIMRTPYSVAPYGPEEYPSDLRVSKLLVDSGYIFVAQDVRGCYLSEGTFLDMRPHLATKSKPTDIDESTDTYDTIDWLVKNIPNNNGRAGQWGISYPGFYSAAGMIDAHPALKAVSPQAPIADWFFDDFHHHGAFFLPHGFNFLSVFGYSRPEPTTLSNKRFDHGTPDGYQFFLDMGSLKHANERYLRDRVPMWNRMLEHPNYDEYWQERNLLPHLKNVAPAVLTVGGWFDAEDLYGPLKIYRAVEKNNPGIFNAIVMGPWRHGGWHRGIGESLGNISFGSRTSPYFEKHIEFPFFEHHLKAADDPHLPEAYVFETGVNRWRKFEHWPPSGTAQKRLYFHPNDKLFFEKPASNESGYDEFISDPKRPVPFTEAITTGMSVEYMTDDQRFASRRPDVLVYQTEVLTEDLTLAGPLQADLRVATTSTDADWIVKLIDVFPADTKEVSPAGRPLGGYQMMVRSEVIRGRFRNSYSKPEPFVPNEITRVPLELLDVLHTFQKGHRLMIQVQSTWFPLVDRNPQKYVPNIYLAKDTDFVKATHRVYFTKEQPSSIEVGVLSQKEE